MVSHADILILGGGIIGCALADELARHGCQVLVVERERLGQEASSAAAGILSAQVDCVQPDSVFELCQAARRMYPRWVEHLERRSDLSVGYHVDGIVSLAMNGREERALSQQARWQLKQGLRVERWSRKELRRNEPHVDGKIRAGFYFPNEAQVDNVRLMQALAIACRKAGVEVKEQTTVNRLIVRGRVIWGVETNRGQLSARIVVNCLGSWASMGGSFPVPVPIEPLRGQMLAFRSSSRVFRRILVSQRAYVVQRRDNRLICGSTMEPAGFTKALTIEGMEGILSGLRQISRALDPCLFLEAWAGFRPATADRRPILGETAIDGLYVAAGHFRHGILLAPITAQVMADLILRGRSVLDIKPFSPQRSAS